MPKQAIADLILVLHLLIVVFNVGSLPVIWVGWAKGWHFVRNFYFRVVHLLLIGFVALEAIVGAICPLTTWEEALRGNGAGGRYEHGFIAHWVHRVLYYDVDPWVFTLGYVMFFILVLLTFILVKPVWPHKGQRQHK